MKIDIPDLKLEEYAVCFECWGSGIIDKENPKTIRKCTNCIDGYKREMTDFGKEVLFFIKRRLKEETQE